MTCIISKNTIMCTRGKPIIHLKNIKTNEEFYSYTSKETFNALLKTETIDVISIKNKKEIRKFFKDYLILIENTQELQNA